MTEGDAERIHRASLDLLDDPGVRIEHDGIYDALDMRTSIAVTGAPENHLLADVSAAMGRFYKRQVRRH